MLRCAKRYNIHALLTKGVRDDVIWGPKYLELASSEIGRYAALVSEDRLLPDTVIGVATLSTQCRIEGWVWLAGLALPIEVLLYVGAPMAPGRPPDASQIAYGEARAEVRAGFETQAGMHRFSIDASELAQKYPGATVYAYGISPLSNVPPEPLSGSGGITLPDSPTMAEQLFDAGIYHAVNPDVAAAALRGGYSSERDHFIRFGQYESRNFSWIFDEQVYLSANPDVAAAVGPAKAYSNGLQHFLQFGYAENRRFSRFFVSVWPWHLESVSREADDRVH